MHMLHVTTSSTMWSLHTLLDQKLDPREPYQVSILSYVGEKTREIHNHTKFRGIMGITTHNFMNVFYGELFKDFGNSCDYKKHSQNCVSLFYKIINSPRKIWIKLNFSDTIKW